jgi:hypothetical protein
VARGSRGQDRAVISHQAPQTEAVGLPEQSWPLMRSQVVWVEEGEETLSRARPARPARSTPCAPESGPTASAHAGLDGDGLVPREGRAATVGASMAWGLRAQQEVGRLGDCGC